MNRSCMTTLVWCFLCGVVFLCAELMAQTNEVVITASPLRSVVSDIARDIDVVGQDDISRHGLSTVPDALEYMTRVSCQERGGGNVQSDLSIRGSTFQQVLVVIDGLPATDPQTAHHNMDLPFGMSSIDSITVLAGPGSALFGPTAFAGVVNIETRRPEKNGAFFRTSYGSFDTRRVECSIDGIGEKSAGLLSSSYEFSDGFQEGTDYELWSIWGSAFLDYEKGGMKISAGYTDKDFGARDFYVPFNSRELTSITHIDVAPEIEIGNGWLLRGIARYRHHEDEFILKREDPEFYRNSHETDSFVERVVLSTPDYQSGSTAVGIERTDYGLDSSNLGTRDSYVNSVFIQHRVSIDRVFSIDTGLRSDHNSMWGGEVSPSLGILFSPDDAVRFRVSGGRAVRPPSYTELYYVDPRNNGNADLDPEESWGGEAGFDVDITENFSVSVTGFKRDTKNLIDWVRVSEDQSWDAVNIGEANFTGGEFSFACRVGQLRMRTSYIYTGVEADNTGLESKYAFNYSRHDLGLLITLPEIEGFLLSCALRYREVPNLDNYTLVSARLSRKFGNAVIFLQGKNLLDEKYQEVPGVPTAGNYLEGGIEMSL